MTDFLVRLIINSLAILAVVRFVPGIEFDVGEGWWRLIGVALILGVVNSYLRPIVKLLALPISLFTLGAVGIVINVAMLLLVAFVSEELRLGFTIAGWPEGPFTLDVIVAGFLASLLISVVSTALSIVFGGARLLGRGL
ncbi:phage holin family protein [soil metagenome]